MSTQSARSRPYVTLALAFAAWKTFLLLVALLSPGVGYDTSTDLLFSGSLQSQAPQRAGWSLGWTFAHHVASKLTRWDAIYFVTIAKRGYLYEQEWAFGWGYSSLVQQNARLLFSNAPLEAHSAIAILISNASHLVSVYLLYGICEEVDTEARHGARSLVVSSLHVIAPAGIFLSAPYGESLFAALTFAGCLAYSRSARGNPLTSTLYLLLAGVLFGVSCTVRGNGIFSGLIFLSDLLQLIWIYAAHASLRSRRALLRAATAIIAGMLVAAGAAYPQYLAWTEYCGHATAGRRPWCESYLPSIYTFVQQHYWNVGFLRYWTLSNLPLFALAAPLLVLMFVSAIWAVRASTSQPSETEPREQAASASKSVIIRTLALPQLVLVILALTNFHVQIITRISSAYPVLYIWLASHLGQRQPTLPHWMPVEPQFIVYWMVVYALVQGSLFAGFLPPA